MKIGNCITFDIRLQKKTVFSACRLDAVSTNVSGSLDDLLTKTFYRNLSNRINKMHVLLRLLDFQ